MISFKSVVILIGLANMLGTAFSQAQSPKLIGNWTVEITFENGEHRSVRFEGHKSGKGSFQLLDAGAKAWGSSEPLEANWIHGDEGAVTISGPMQFPLGNVGIDRGTLVLKGKFGTEGGITGQAMFFPLGQDPDEPQAKASKSGAFQAIRATGEDHSKPPAA